MTRRISLINGKRKRERELEKERQREKKKRERKRMRERERKRDLKRSQETLSENSQFEIYIRVSSHEAYTFCVYTVQAHTPHPHCVFINSRLL